MKSLCLGTMEISFYWEDEVEDKACKMETQLRKALKIILEKNLFSRSLTNVH